MELSSNTEQSISDEYVRKNAVYCLCKIINIKRYPQLTVRKDNKRKEMMGIHCFKQIVEAVKEDAVATGTCVSPGAATWISSCASEAEIPFCH